MEISIIVICGTIIVVTLFMFMLFKDKNSGGTIEWDAETKKLKLIKSVNKINEKFLHGQLIENNSVYKNKDLVLYKDFTKVINIVLLEVLKILVSSIYKNNFVGLSPIDFSMYVDTKREEIINTFNRVFNECDNDLLKILTYEQLFGKLRPMMSMQLTKFYDNILDNHKELENKIKNMYYCENITNCEEHKQLIQNTMLEVRKLRLKDFYQIYNLEKEFMSMILQLFYEYIED